jgi:hypothetical protein
MHRRFESLVGRRIVGSCLITAASRSEWAPTWCIRLLLPSKLLNGQYCNPTFLHTQQDRSNMSTEPPVP